MMKTKTFDCVDWVRSIRDDNYKKNKALPAKEFAQELVKDVKKSDLWIRIKEKGIEIR